MAIMHLGAGALRVLGTAFAGLTLFAAGSQARGQQAGQDPFAAPLAVPEPNYVTIVLEKEVKRPARSVWNRIGRFCAIAEWRQIDCRITKGDEWSLGSVRIVRNAVVEMMVAKTALSYTYTQPVRVVVPFNAYHTTLEVRPVSATTSRIIQSIFYDNSMLADDTARAAEIAERRRRIDALMTIMKTLAEGGRHPSAARP